MVGMIAIARPPVDFCLGPAGHHPDSRTPCTWSGDHAKVV